LRQIPHPRRERTLPDSWGGLGRGILLCVAFFFQIGITYGDCAIKLENNARYPLNQARRGLNDRKQRKHNKKVVRTITNLNNERKNCDASMIIPCRLQQQDSRLLKEVGNLNLINAKIGESMTEVV